MRCHQDVLTRTGINYALSVADYRIIQLYAPPPSVSQARFPRELLVSEIITSPMGPNYVDG